MMPTIVSALPDLDRAGKKCFAVKESGGKKTAGFMVEVGCRG